MKGPGQPESMVTSMSGKTWLTPVLAFVVLIGLALPSAAQATSVNVLRLIELARDEEPRPRTQLPFMLEAEALDHVRASVRDVALPVARESLENAGEATVPFAAAPGGIVLGLTAASPSPDFAGARLEFDASAQLYLRRTDGRRFALPAIDRESLASLLAFASSEDSDTLIDIYGNHLRLDPAFVDTGLARHLERADRAPRLAIPGHAEHKSLIVDRAVSFEARSERLLLSADVEVRFYTKKESWLLPEALERVGTWAFVDGANGLDPVEPLPPGTDLVALRANLKNVSRLAAWLGFLRWAAAHDPVGVAELRRALQAGKASASQD